jgi:cytochrome c oxidase assembly protein subunit 15
MVAIGGITRLTESGLSITEWNVVMGSIPPLNDADWQMEFQKYQQSPEFMKKNLDFTVNDFKQIYWWEWIHRQWGRIIGLVFFIPFLIFLSIKYFKPSGVKRLVFIFILGGIQGFIGWYMVKSGLVNEPRVSHYRLALHLITALFTISLIWWLFLDIQNQYRPHQKTKSIGNHKRFFLVFFILFIIQIVYGAFIAGLDAGQLYNTWPKMGEEWIASGVFNGDFITVIHAPENVATIQFIHRTLAVVVVLFVGGLWFSAIRSKQLNASQMKGLNGMMLIVICQFILGVFTLLNHVPVSLGLLHQLGAVLLLLYSLHHLHTLIKAGRY